MTSIAETSAPRFSAIGAVLQIRRYLEAVPYSVLALPLRLAIATVFWNSGMTKLADWNTALALFTDEYHVPLLPPEVAAYLSATIELTAPPLLVMGLLTRPVAFVLLGMTTVIEVFVYPEAWPTHIQWAAMLLVLLFRGAGSLSLDHLVYRRVASSPDLPA
ncbi:DoxX family protein [Rhodopila globiformis]|uniref:DoxX family protein n=1 Tax=Rhodopila globiformis TaxID=1071 RepID=A0A2S6NNW7_RHOGL|nr:DoxX family protein [Rhodopila globiformis]PPQ39522.1 DoxX family protein [Rhodopila globiformis]